MSREIDFDKKLSDEDLEYVRSRGNPEDMRRAGLMDPQTFDLSHVPDSLEPHEVTGDPEPVFDHDSKVAEKSVGNPDDDLDKTLQSSPVVPFDEQFPREPFDPKKSAKAAAGATSETPKN